MKKVHPILAITMHLLFKIICKKKNGKLLKKWKKLKIKSISNLSIINLNKTIESELQ